MKTIEEQLGFYLHYHKNPWNVATHFVGIPAIILSLLIPMGWLRFMEEPLPLTGALVFIVVVWVYYLLLDPGLAISILVFILPALYVADLAARLSWAAGAGLFIALFVGGWIFQLVGHAVFEKKKPAFVDNLIQLLIGPLFLVAEILFYLGMRGRLRAGVARVEASLLR